MCHRAVSYELVTHLGRNPDLFLAVIEMDELALKLIFLGVSSIFPS
jgi:hypothetical protein